MKELTLLTISGFDRPGITAGLMDNIKKSNASIEDMGQSITHGLLSLSILISTTDSTKKDELIKELLFHTKELGVFLDYKTIEDAQMIHEIGDKYMLSCVSLKGITADFLFDISNCLAANNINIQRIENLSLGEFKSLDIATLAHSPNVEWNRIKQELIALSNKHSTDLALIKDDVWRRNKRLIVFDMDSTLIQSEVIVEMAKVHGVGAEVHEITERAMNGEFDFDDSLRNRVSLLKGLAESELEGILKNIKLTEGVAEFVKTVKALGYKVAIISGGFQYFANHFKDILGLDYAFANDLEISNGLLTGNVKGPIVNAEKKAMILDMLAQQENLKLEQVVAIGDGANDLEMLAKAGLGIAFHAKDIVKENAGHHMSHGTMTSILYFLGIPGTQK